MTDTEIQAYRHLLYVAMLSIRNHCQPRAALSLNPYVWYKFYIRGRLAGVEADWLHNLAEFSSVDFEGFDQGAFWCELESLSNRYKQANLEKYKRIFENYLAGNIQIV